MQIKKYLFSTALLIAVSMSTVYAQGTMTDKQVLEYAKKAIKSGKDQNSIVKELATRGVTRQQAERVKKLYEEEQKKAQDENSKDEKLKNDKKSSKRNANTLSQNSRTQGLGQDTRQYVNNEMDEDEYLYEEEEEDSIFGRNIFRNRTLNFAPSDNLATPRNYALGPGDEVIIDIFGANQTQLRETISPEGSINVDVLGPIYLNGMTVEEANTFLKKRLAAIYAGLNRKGSTDIRLTLGEIRTIQINILGDVANPGTYTLSSLATVFHALYRAGGIVGTGTLRNILVSRNGRTVGKVDVYDFLMNGSRKSDIRLQEGDVILVKPYEILVNVDGKVKRPMYYEMKEGESMKSLLDYAGGFAQGAYNKNVTVVRQNGRQYEVCTVDEFDYSTFHLMDGDSVRVGALLSRFENRIEIKGAVYKEGLYQLGVVNSVHDLVNKADGVLPEAFLSRAVLHRERPDRSLEVLSVDLQGILDGTSPDIPLRNNDILFVPSKYDLQDLGTLEINGEVTNPGTFPYSDNTTIEDLVLLAGGLTDAASLARVDVARRISDNTSTKSSNKIAEHFSFSMKKGFVVDGQPGFTLKPYDVVTVRRSPGYHEQQFVKISGEANYTGDFPIIEKGMRLSQLVEMAGGPTDNAYIKGARLERVMTLQEQQKLKEIVTSMRNSGDKDTINAGSIDIGETYYVGINLEKAIANPGCNDDVVLRAGDILDIPLYSNVVRISGAVISANTVAYEEGKKAKWYIENAGGYADNARKRRAYVIEMNGHIKKLKKRSKVEPGSEIIVPQKIDKPGALQNILSIASTSASMATMLATIYNIIKR